MRRFTISYMREYCARICLRAREQKREGKRGRWTRTRACAGVCTRRLFSDASALFSPRGGPEVAGSVGRLPSSSFSLLPPPSRGPHRRVFTKTWFDQPWSIRFFPTIRSRSKTKWKGNTRYFVSFFLSFRLRCEKRYWNVVELNGRIVNRQFAGWNDPTIISRQIYNR